MINENEIDIFLSKTNYDIRISHSARWIDQKLTPDMLWSISDFIADYIQYDNSKTFTPRDIWNSDYAKLTIKQTYTKPDTDDKTAENEYDKVFSQPLNLLCYSKIIEDISEKRNRHLYIVREPKLLEYIARNDLYSYKFLVKYITKVLMDSDLYKYFDDFFNYQNKEYYDILKNTFTNFYHFYTPVQKELEPHRIFTKVLNPLACSLNKLGTKNGYISKNIITTSELMYNRDNFRDLYMSKPKDVTRKDWLSQNSDIKYNVGYFEQMMNSAKRILKEFNRNCRSNVSELTMFSSEHSDNNFASQIHHIFPKSDFPMLMHYIENLIMLTPNQHLVFAHHNNNTQYVDKAAQKELLIAKTYSIKDNLENVNQEHIYDFNSLLYVLSNGFNDDKAFDIAENDYYDVLNFINIHY